MCLFHNGLSVQGYKAEDVMKSLLEEYLLKEDSLEEEVCHVPSAKSIAEVLPSSSPKELPGLDLFPEKECSQAISCASNGKFTSVVVSLSRPSKEWSSSCGKQYLLHVSVVPVWALCM